MDDETRHQLVVAVVAFGIVLSFVYSIVNAQILIWLSVVSILLLFYLLWRLVRHERIADALENGE